eukprot:5687652-Alexandrium_andersonii.AAC.1
MVGQGWAVRCGDLASLRGSSAPRSSRSTALLSSASWAPTAPDNRAKHRVVRGRRRSLVRGLARQGAGERVVLPR